MASDLVLNRLTPPGEQFTLVTLRVLDEEPDAGALLRWYRKHLHQIVVVNLLEGTPDFAFTDGPPTGEEMDALISRLASGEHAVDLDGHSPTSEHSDESPFGSGSWITARAYDLGDGRWLSVLFGTLTWPAVLREA